MSGASKQRASDRRGFLRAAGAAIVGGGAAVVVGPKVVGGRTASTPAPVAPSAGEPVTGARRVNVAPRAVPSVRR